MTGGRPDRPPAAPREERLEDLYAGALERNPGDRAEWLAGACADDPVLRAEVEALLACGEEAEDWFDGLEGRVRAIPPAELVADIPEGETIGPYEVREVLGRGGMGVVRRAVDTRLGREVAIKLLPPWLAGDAHARARLVAEARAASALDHPNIGTLHDVVEMEDGRLALVLAHYEGDTLRDRLARGPLEPAEALSIARQAAAGLAAAHAGGIVHRDVKPANLFLTAAGPVKVLDFGVAKVRDADVTATGDGRRPGTTAYMSPEQLRGDAVDHRSDLWSLGVVLHEMATGERPFRGDGEAALVRAILEDEPPLHAAPPEVAPILARLLERDPTRRFADADALLDALDGSAGHGIGDRTGRPARFRRRAAVGALAGLALVLLGPRLAHRPADPASRLAGLPAAAADADRLAILPFAVYGDPDLAYLREGLVDLLGASLHGTAGLRTVDSRALLGRADAAAIYDPPAAAALARDFGAGRFVLGEVVEAAGRVRIRVGLYDRAAGPEPVAQVHVEGSLDRLFNLVDEVAGQLIVADRRGPEGQLVRVASVTTASLPAFKRYLEGERAMRRGQFIEALAAFQSAAAIDSLFALAHYRASVAAGWIQRLDVSLAAAERAVGMAERLPSTERRLLEASLAWPRGEGALAERLYREVLDEQPENLAAWYGLGETLIHTNPLRGRSIAEAREPFERAVGLSPFDQYESLVHLADLAARDGRRADYDSLYARLRPEADLAFVYRAQKVLVTGSEAERRAVLAELARADPATVRLVAGRLAGFVGDPRGALRVARLLTEPDRRPTWRAIGHLISASMAVGIGRWTEAGRHLDAAAELAPAPARVHRAHLLSLPFAPDDPAALAGARAALEARDPAEWPAERSPILAVNEPIYEPVARYLAGILAARGGDVEGLDRAARALEGRRGATAVDSLARDLATGLRARRADGDAAAAILVRSRFEREYRRVVRSPFYSRSADRYLLARSLEAAGRPLDAAGWYASLLGSYVDDAVFYGPAHAALARIHEAEGRPREAARHYRAFIELWEDADPALQPRVERARRRLEALGG